MEDMMTPDPNIERTLDLLVQLERARHFVQVLGMVCEGLDADVVDPVRALVQHIERTLEGAEAAGMALLQPPGPKLHLVS
jgi:hypothetical protein